MAEGLPVRQASHSGTKKQSRSSLIVESWYPADNGNTYSIYAKK